MSNPFLIQPDAVYLDGEVRLALGITSAALSLARRERRLRFSKQGNSILYRGQWLLDWLERDATSEIERVRRRLIEVADRKGRPVSEAIRNPTKHTRTDEVTP